MCELPGFVCLFVERDGELTEVLDDVVYGGPEQRIHGIWTHPQHPLGRPLNEVHTAKKKKGKKGSATQPTHQLLKLQAEPGKSWKSRNVLELNSV